MMKMTDEGYRAKVIDHFKNGHATETDWTLMGKVFLEMSTMGSKSGDISLAELNTKIKKDV